MLGERLMPELVKSLDGPAVSYGKGAIVGVAGEMEHGGACVHPMLGKPMRAAIGGGKAVIGANVKVAAAGAVLDVPLGHKDGLSAGAKGIRTLGPGSEGAHNSLLNWRPRHANLPLRVSRIGASPAFRLTAG